MEIHALITKVAAVRGVTLEQVLSSRRNRPITMARHEAMKAVRALHPNMSAVQLGRIFNRDHSSVLFALGTLKRKPNYYINARYHPPKVAAE